MSFRMARADDYLLTAEEIRLRHQKRKRIFVVTIFLLVLALVGIFATRPARNAIKSWQARRHAHKAFALIAAENWHDAHDEALAAYQLQPAEPEALRAVARFLSRLRDPAALEFWKKIKTLSRDDLRDEAGIALFAGETETAESAIKSLFANASDKPSAADWLLAAQLAMQKQSADEAQHDVEKVFSDSRATEREQFQATLFQLAVSSAAGAATQEAQQRAAWARLQKIAEGKSSTSLDALMVLSRRALSQHPGGTSGARPEPAERLPSPSSTPGSVPSSTSSDATESVPPILDLVHALETHPLAGPTQKLFALDLQMHADPSQRDSLIARGIADWKDAPAADLAVLAEWLNVKGEFQRQLDAIPLEKALQNRDLFLRHFDALGALGRWDEIRQLLEAERFPLDPVMQQMYLARCYAQLGQKTAAENNWQRALEAAGGDAPKLMPLADFAEKNGVTEIADKAYAAAATQAPKLRAAQQGRLRIAQASRDTKRIHTVLADMLTLWPNDTAIQNDEAYTRLLLLPTKSGGTGSTSSSKKKPDDTEVIPPTANGGTASTPSLEAIDLTAASQIEKLAEKLVEREPTSLAHRTLLALARLRRDQPDRAIQAYGIQVPEETLTASAVTVRAAVLQANGRYTDARIEISRLRGLNLLEEESRLISNIR